MRRKRAGVPVQAYVPEQDLEVLREAGVNVSEVIRQAIRERALAAVPGHGISPSTCERTSRRNQK